MQESLRRFHTLRTIFEECGIRPDGFSLPRQHSLVHYVDSIMLFGSPNGLCSSITESRHITAVKKPWRRSNRNNALSQILTTNTRLSKLAAARVEFGRRGMARGSIVDAARATRRTGEPLPRSQVQEAPTPDPDSDAVTSRPTSSYLVTDDDTLEDDEDEAMVTDGPAVESHITLPSRPGKYLL